MGNIVAISVLGVLLVLVFSFAYGWPRRQENGRSVKRTLSPTFARVYGLISIAVLAVATVLITTETEVITGVFTLFGTIAGYLAGSKVEAVGGKPQAPPAGGNDGDTTGSGQASLELN